MANAIRSPRLTDDERARIESRARQTVDVPFRVVAGPPGCPRTMVERIPVAWLRDGGEEGD